MKNTINFIEGKEYLDIQQIEIMIYYSPSLEKKDSSFFFNKKTDSLCIRPNYVFFDMKEKPCTPNGSRIRIFTLRG